MLSNLRIRNFKAWEDTGDIRMAPITLFFGANSSGKSSIGQFLMMLKQTADSSDRKTVLNTGERYSAVQLGTFIQMVHRRNPTLRIGFEYSWQPQRGQLETHNPTDNTSHEPAIVGPLCDQISFEAEIGLSEQRDNRLAVYQFRYGMIAKNTPPFSIGYKRNKVAETGYSVEASQYTLQRHQTPERRLPEPDRFYGFPDEVFASYQNAGTGRDLVFEHDVLFRSMYYLGPLRTRPEREYTWLGNPIDDVGYAGENAVAAMLGAERGVLDVPSKAMGPLMPGMNSVPRIVFQELAEMGLVLDSAAYPIANRPGEYEIKVRVPGSVVQVDLPDVGFGVSQVLPVLVQCFCAPFDSIIIMEQPEMHLHPRAQAALADVMIDVINSQENGVDRNIQLIIETHSEHFLRRLQRRIAEDKLSQDKVAAYFVEMDGAAKLERLKIDEFGNIANWPKDFFGDQFGDIAEHSLAAARKKVAQATNGGQNGHS